MPRDSITTPTTCELSRSVKSAMSPCVLERVFRSLAFHSA